MRIHGGRWHGRVLRFRARRGVRPLTARWRQVLSDKFPDMEGVEAADLFAGTGAWGVSLLSHGAARVEFFDASRRAMEEVDRALRDLGAAAGSWETVPGPLPATLEGRGPYGLVACDPPFTRLGLGRRVVEAAAGKVAPDGLLLVRWPAPEEPPEPYNLGLAETLSIGRERVFAFRP